MSPRILTEPELMKNRLAGDFFGSYNPLVQVSIYILAKIIEGNLGSDSERTAILYAQTDGELAADLMLIATLPNTLYSEAKRGRKVEVFNYATSSDLEKVLRDESFQHLFIYGHGTPYHWRATDGWVSVEDLDDIGFSKKHGEVVKLTCNEGCNQDEFALRITSNPINASYFNGNVSKGQILEYLKHRAHKYKA